MIGVEPVAPCLLGKRAGCLALLCQLPASLSCLDASLAACPDLTGCTCNANGCPDPALTQPFRTGFLEMRLLVRRYGAGMSLCWRSWKGFSGRLLATSLCRLMPSPIGLPFQGDSRPLRELLGFFPPVTMRAELAVGIAATLGQQLRPRTALGRTCRAMV